MTYETILTEANKAYLCCEQNNVLSAKAFLQRVQDLCKNEINTAQAKTKGGSSEVKRKKAAEEILKCLPIAYQRNKGYCKIGRDFLLPNGDFLKDGIVLTNGYVLYIGTMIAGIEPEIPKGIYFKWGSIVDDIIKNQKATHLTNTEEIDLPTLKSNLKIAKAEAKAKGIKTKDMLGVIPESCLITHNSEEKKNAVFSADYIIKACEMLGGKEWKITTTNRRSGAIIEGENGICIVMPINHEEWVEVE